MAGLSYNPRSYLPSQAGKTAKPPARTPAAPAVGSPAWLVSAPSQSVAAWVSTLQPDYSQVPKVDTAAASKYAQEQADAYMKPYLDQRAADQGRLDAQRAASLEAGTNFSKALADVLTGGQQGEAGRQYALKTFGGSFLGELQTAEGQKMFVDITRDFNQQDALLADKYAQILDKRPDLYQQMLDNYVQAEQENRKQGIALADSSYEHRLKAASLILANTQKREANLAKALGSSQYSYRNLANGQLAVIDNATGKQVGTIGQPRVTKPAKRSTSWQTVNGQRVLVDDQTGAVIRAAGKAGTGKAKTRTAVVAKARQDAISLARSYFTQKTNRPTGQQAGDALWDSYGKAMIDAGVSRAAAARVIAAAVRTASGGAWRWNPNQMGPPAPTAGTSSNPFTGG